MTTVVTMSKTGRITLPAEIRRALHIQGEADFLVEALEHGEGIVLRPAIVTLRDDAWVYTAEDLEGIEQGLRDLREGRERSATEADFRSLANVDPD